MPASNTTLTTLTPTDVLKIVTNLRAQRKAQDALKATGLTAKQQALLGQMFHLRLQLWAYINPDLAEQPTA